MKYSDFMLIKYFRLLCIVKIKSVNCELIVDNSSNVLEDYVRLIVPNVTFEGLNPELVKFLPNCTVTVNIKEVEIVSIIRGAGSPLRSESDLGELRKFYRL